MAPKKSRRTKKTDLQDASESNITFGNGPIATSSPAKENISDKENSSNVDILQNILKIHSAASNQKQRDLLQKMEDQKLLTKRHTKIIKLQLGPNRSRAIAEYWVENVISECSSEEIVPSRLSRKALAELHTKTNFENPRTRSSSAPNKNRGKSKPTFELDVGGFKKPKGSIRSSSQSRVASIDKFITPLKKGQYNVATVTPCRNMQTPLAVMRRPVAGEMAISLSGSPLLVSSDVTTTNMPHLSVPIDANRVLSIFPRDGFTVDNMPLLDETTKRQLNTLRNYLNHMCENTSQ